MQNGQGRNMTRERADVGITTDTVSALLLVLIHENWSAFQPGHLCELLDPIAGSSCTWYQG